MFYFHITYTVIEREKMNKLITGFTPFDNVRRNAYWAHTEIDSRFPLDESTINFYSKHLKDKIKHPTNGMLAMREMSKTSKNYPMAYDTKMKILNKQIARTAKLFKKYNDLINTIYPKTKKIREYIINHDKVVLHKVKKTNGFSLINNLIYSLLRK